MKKKHKDELEPFSKLEKDFDNPDPHFRENAIIGFGKYFENDEVRKKLTEKEKTIIVDNLLKCLNLKEEEVDDYNINLKTRAMKILKEISIHLTQAEIIQIFSIMMNIIVDPKSKAKDISANCIKTILEKVPGSFYETVGKTIVPTLTKELDLKNQEITLLCLDTFNEYMKKFGYKLIKKEHTTFKIDEEKIVKVILENVNTTYDSLKIKSIEILGTIGVLLNKEQINETTQKLIDLTKNSRTISEKKNYILALKSLGHTLSLSQDEKIYEIISLLINYINKDFLESEGDYDEKISLVETTMNCIEIYIITSISVLKDLIKKIIQNSLDLLIYDPCNSNFSEPMPIEGYEDYEVDGGDAYLEDTSWKVRKAASKILRMILVSGYDFDIDIKEKVMSALINSFGEKEENAKIEINLTLKEYIDSLAIVKKNQNNLELMNVHSIIVKEYIPKVAKELINRIIKNLKKATNDNIIKSTLEILPSLVVVCPEQIIEDFENLKEGLDKTCFKSNQNTIILMSFLTNLFLSIEIPNDYTNEIISNIIEYLKRGISNNYYKVSSEAIKVAGILFKLLSLDESGNKSHIMNLFNDILPKFKAKDIDTEIKIASSKAIADFIIYCGKFLNQYQMKEIFKIFVDNINNDLIKSNMLTILNDIFSKDTRGINLDEAIIELYIPLLGLLEGASMQNMIKILILLDNFYKKKPNIMKDSTSNIVDKLLSIKISDGILLYLFNIFKNMVPFLDELKIKAIFDYIENKFSGEEAIDNYFLSSLFDFTRLGCEKLKKEDLGERVKKYSPKIGDLNESMSYYFSIIICHSGEESHCLLEALNQLEGLTEKLENKKKFKTIFELIGDICENSHANHEELFSNLDKLKNKLGNKEIDNISKIIGKIGVNNHIGFINKLITKEQDQNILLSLKEFLNLIEKKNIKITDANIEGLIEWLLNTPKLEEEIINKNVGTCIGLIIKLDKELLNKYINLLKENTGNKKSSLLYSAKEIFKSKLIIPKSTLKLLYEQITEEMKSPEILIKEHSLQALSYLQYNYKTTLKDFYLDKENRKFIGKSCLIDKSYIKESDFGNGNKIIEDRGKGIRRAALDIQTFVIVNFPNKLVYDEIIPLLIECLRDTEDYLQQIVYNDLIKLAKLKPKAFLPFGAKLIEMLFQVFKKLRIEESKKNFSINVKKLFEELKDIESIIGNPQYGTIIEAINKF